MQYLLAEYEIKYFVHLIQDLAINGVRRTF